VPAFPPEPVETVTEGCEQALHETAQIALPRLKIQMEMIGHYAITARADAELLREPAQLLQKKLVMRRRKENPVPLVASVYNMITGPRIFYPQRSCHLPPPVSLVEHAASITR
jgi:hypothetical protein